jgi:hypothetical protein
MGYRRNRFCLGPIRLRLMLMCAKAFWNLDAATVPYLNTAIERSLGTAKFENFARAFLGSIRLPNRLL